MDLKNKISRIINFVESCPNKSIIAVEGKCASGKTTISANLTDYTVIHMDDFFLPMHKKTPARMEEVGGNIDYELVHKTLEALILSLNNNQDTFKFKIFDCSNQTYVDKEIKIKEKIILEGVYSTHYYFQHLINYIIYVDVSQDVQYERISKRKMADRFFNEWMKYEEAYFKKYNIKEKAHLIV
ncbi:MAG: AAA family ATPase [Bacilli bacterium]|nr:AAA family ATPase [Bacilli bacterium]